MPRHALNRALGLLALLAATGVAAGCDTPAPDADADADTAADADADADADVELDSGDADDGEPDAEVADADDDGDAETPALPTEADFERLSDLVEALSTDELAGRLTGTPSGDAAEAMVLAALADAGLETATQDVTFPLYVVGSPAELSVIDAEGVVETTLAYIDDYREVDFSGSGRVEGDTVFVGYGLVAGDYDAYEGIDVTGKIVVALTGIPDGYGLVAEDDGRLDLKIDEAYDHGAIGVIFVPAGDQAAYDRASPAEMELSATDKYGDFHADLHHPELPVAFLHLSAVPTALLTSASQLGRTAPGTPLETRLRLEINGTVDPDAECRNVFGIMRGADEGVGEEVMLLGAHYDHLGVGADGRIFNGAADNASGTGIVLETAATLAATGLETRRTVVFALFCAEEQGLWGSLEYGYYGTPLFPMDDTVLMIQVDYIGGADGPYLTNGNVNEMLSLFVGDERNADDLPLRYLDWGGDCASDDCVFSWVGVPAYRFIANGELHHVAEDDFDTLDLEMIDRVADLCIRGVGAVAFR